MRSILDARTNSKPVRVSGEARYISATSVQVPGIPRTAEGAGKDQKGWNDRGKKTSNVYKIIGTQDYSPEQIKEEFDALRLQSVTAEDQIKEYVSVGSTRKEATPDNPRGYTW
ncbi:hypothetical protein ACETU7_06535 [Rhodococcus sp. 3Y1]